MGGSRNRLVLVLLCLTAFTLTAIDARGGDGSPFAAVRRGADTVFGPVQRAVGGAARAAGDGLGGLPRISSYREQAERLERENTALRAELRETDLLRRQQAEWNALMRLKDFGTFPVVPARVSAVGSSLGFEWTATLDVGSADGVQAGMTVVNGDGLVGRTTRVGPYTSTVLLLVDPGFTVGATLQRAGTFGLATGAGLGPLRFSAVQGGRFEIGDALVTSGSDVFVPGVPVGRLRAVSADAVTRSGVVDPFVDVTALGLVGVVTQPPRSTPRIPIPPAPAPPPAPGPPAPAPAPGPPAPGPAAP